MATEMPEVKKPRTKLEEMMEDYALGTPPAEYRRSLPVYFAVMGTPICLYYFAIGSLGCAMAGLWMGILATVIACAFVWIFGRWAGRLTWRAGYSYEVFSRFLGWGHKGSIIPSICSTVLLWSFYVMEMYWMGAAFHYIWPVNVWFIYLPLFVLFIVLTIFGHKVIGAWGYAAIPIGIGASIYLILKFYVFGGFSLADTMAFAQTPIIPGGFGGALSFALMAVALVTGPLICNYGRFCSTERHAGNLGISCALGAHILMPIIGILIIFPLIVTLIPIVGEAEAGLMAFETSVPFVVAFGALGAIIVVAYQANVEYTNIWLPSIALANLFHAAFGIRIPRWGWVIITSAISLALLAGGLFGIMVEWSAWTGLALMVAFIISFADWCWRRWHGLSVTFKWEEIWNVNPVAIIVWVVSYAIAIALWKTGVISSPTLIGGAICFVLYLAGCYLTKGKYQQPAPTAGQSLSSSR